MLRVNRPDGQRAIRQPQVNILHEIHAIFCSSLLSDVFDLRSLELTPFFLSVFDVRARTGMEKGYRQTEKRMGGK